MDLDAAEIRVLGCLVEKQRTTPDAYPLSVNALRLACNQSTNREPVVDYDEPTIRDALGLDDAEISLLAVLMLRGPQTPGELKQRSERLHRFESVPEAIEKLEGLVARELAVRLPRRPGQKEERYAHALGADEPEAPAATGESRLGALERRLAEVEARLDALERV